MKKIIQTMSAGVALLGFAVSANAADLPKRMPVKAVPYAKAYNWTGLYLGVHAGYGFGNSDWTQVPAPQAQGSHKMNGALIGGQIGYNWQAAGSALVLGIEADGSWASINGSHNDPTATLLETRVRGIGTLTGRIGYAMNNVLLYAKAGGALVNVKYNDTFGAVFNGATTATRTGYLLGAGVEYGFTPNWSAKLEYNYVGLGSKTFTLTGGAAPFTETIRDSLHLVKAGVNYRF